MKKFNNLLFSIIFMFSLFINLSAQTKDSKDSQNKTDKRVNALKIISKPKPPLSRDCNGDSGRISLRVTFDKSAKVTEVTIVKSSFCNSFDAGAIEAARKIKFVPAQKDGEAITVTKLVEYSYNRF